MKPLKVHIAASSDPAERPRVDAAFAALQAVPGIEIVGDWRADVDAAGGNPSGADAKAFAAKDLAAIRAANCVWLLVPEHPSRGAWIELGYALGRDTSVVASGRCSTSIFTALCRNRYDTDVLALKFFAFLIASTPAVCARMGLMPDPALYFDLDTYD